MVDSASREAISFATIKLFAQDNPKKALRVVATDASGKFEFAKLPNGKYELLCEFVGKNSLRLPIATQREGEQTSPQQSTTADAGIIALADNSHALDEVTVTALKPLVKVDLDKITYDMQADPEAQTSTVLDMLRKVPMVTVDGEENVQLKGSTNFKFYLNGKPSSMLDDNPKDVLKSIPASTVKNIEVITDPGARYDAEGVTGIINIVTESNTSMAGYTGSVNGGMQMMGDGIIMPRGGAYFSVKYGKVGVTTNLYTGTWQSPRNSYTMVRETFGSNPDLLYSNGKNVNRGNYLGGSVEASYEIDTLRLLTFNVRRWGNLVNTRGENQRDNMLMLPDSMNPIYHYQQNTITENFRNSIATGADYQRTFGVKDRLLTLSYRLSMNNSDYPAHTEVTPILNYAPRPTMQTNNADSYEHTIQADFTTPIAKIHTIETGLKYIRRDNRSQSSIGIDTADGALMNIPSANDRFQHTQDIAAVYAGYNLRYEKWGFKAGLRYEGTWLNADYPINREQNFNANYSSAVPSVTATYKLAASQTLRLGYNMRIYRPGIWQLNPYANTTDSNYISQGNPNLDAAQYHNISLNYSFFHPKLNMNINASYNTTNNGIIEFAEIRNGRSYSTYRNIAESHAISTSGYANWTPVDKLRIFFNGGINYFILRANNGSGLRNSGFGGYGSGGAQYTFPLDIMLSMNGNVWKQDPTLQTNSTSSYWFHSLSLSRDFLDKKLNVRLSVNSPFLKNLTYAQSELSTDYRIERESIQRFRSVNIQVQWRFGEMKAQIKKTQRSIDNDDAMGGGGGVEGGGGN
ncbi:TonB-dependent receptor [Bacteroidia bacterium]|nr:TonB-dependent receptor [Bacteroidia bacterium]